MEKSIIDALIDNIDKSTQGNTGPFFTYIIGNNGCGKSRVLAEIADRYNTGDYPKVRAIPCITNAVYDRFRFASPNKIEYLGLRSVNNALFHGAIDRQLVKLLMRGIASEKLFFKKRLHQAMNVRLSFIIKPTKIYTESGNIEDLLDMRKVKAAKKSLPIRRISEQRLFNRDEISFIKGIVDVPTKIVSITRADAINLMRFLDLNPDIEILVEKEGEVYSFSDLSSGEQNRLLLAAKILSSVAHHSLVIIDEPEISMHLQWQIEFHGLIKALLGSIKNYHVLIATHSPIIVSEAAKDRIADSIIILEKIDPKASVGDEVLDSFGNIGFEKITSTSVKGFDELVLDQFDVVPYNAIAVFKEIAESLLGASEAKKNKNPAGVKKSIDILNKIPTKVGATPEIKQAVKDALNLITEHFEG